jgi:penicillin-binding protein 1C
MSPRLRRALLALCALSVATVALAHVSSVAVDSRRDLDPNRVAPLRVLDRHGQLLRSVPSSARPLRAGWTKLDQVSATAVLTLLASEDQAFFAHGGVDGLALLRALWLDLKALGPRYGASTLTMQLARMAYPEQIGRSLLGKLRQARAAWAIERALSKREILEQYLNRAYFGHGAYGIEAAAQTYFQKPAISLSDAQATLLMVLVRGPASYDLLRQRARALTRRDHLLGLLVGQQRLSAQARAQIRAEPLTISLREPSFEAGHFVDWALSELPREELSRGGTLHTSLDLTLQRALEHRTREHLAALREKDADQAGVVVLDTQSGEVLAMVGSRKYAEAQGQINIATWRRFPGSALKPFVYAAAIERGKTPVTLAYDVYDVPSAYVVRGMVPEEHGPARYREALAGSYNLAAVHVLEEVGLEPVINLLKRAGVAELNQKPSDYGLRLSLGSTKVRLLDLASSYGAFTRAGRVVRARGIRALTRADGTRVVVAAAGEETHVLSPETAWLVMDMLADPEARRPRFGDDLPFDLPYRVAAKTGTARGFSDTVAIASTRELTVAAWTGRFDGGSMQGLSGMRGAAALARAALLSASHGRALTLPTRPAGIAAIDVCPLSGKLAGPHCPRHKRDYAHVHAPPSEPCDMHGADGTIHYPELLRGYLTRTGARLAAQR